MRHRSAERQWTSKSECAGRACGKQRNTNRTRACAQHFWGRVPEPQEQVPEAISIICYLSAFPTMLVVAPGKYGQRYALGQEDVFLNGPGFFTIKCSNEFPAASAKHVGQGRLEARLWRVMLTVPITEKGYSEGPIGKVWCVRLERSRKSRYMTRAVIQDWASGGGRVSVECVVT